MRATIPKGIVGGFELTVLQRHLKEWNEWPWMYVCLRVLKGSNKSRFDSYLNDVYSYFEKGCRKKCAPQYLKVLWVVLS